MRVGLATLLAQRQPAQAARVFPAWRDRAAHEGHGYADLLQGPGEEVLAARMAAATGRRLRAAACPVAATSAPFDCRFRPDRKRQVVLRSLDPTFVAQAGTSTLGGPPGRGKMMLADRRGGQAGAARPHRPLRHRPGPRRPARAHRHRRRPPTPPHVAAHLRRARARRTRPPADRARLRAGPLRGHRRAL